MIIWINGAFGSGKTQTAFELHRRLPDSYVYDPENVGYLIQKNIPSQARIGDFQNYPTWRQFNYSLLRHVAMSFDGAIIVPMTIVNPDYFAEIVGSLRGDGIVVQHFTLCATKDVLTQRLRSRLERKGSWPERQIDRCLEGLSDPVFAHHLDTNQMSIDAVVEEIAALSGVKLEPDRRGAFRKRYDRVMTQLRSIRLFG